MASMRFTGTLMGNLDTLNARNIAAIAASGKLIAQEGEAYMRSNAPWNDVTGNARSGLTGEVEAGSKGATVYYFHQVPYGIWLEIANSGKYQIILPTVQRMGPRWFTLLQTMIFKGA